MDENAHELKKSKFALTLAIIGFIIGLVALPIATITIFGPVILSAVLPPQLFASVAPAFSAIRYASYCAQVLALAFALAAVAVAFVKKTSKILPFITVAIALVPLAVLLAGRNLDLPALQAPGIDVRQLEFILNNSPAKSINRTPLMVAAGAGRTEEVKALLKEGADPLEKNVGYLTAAGLAVGNGHLETVKAFLEVGAIANNKEYLGELLLVAAMENRLDIARLLLEHDAEIDRRGLFGMSPLMHAVDAQNWEIAEMLMEKGADVNMTNKRGWNVLSMAAMDGNLEMVQNILDYGGNINAQTAEGWTPLMAACYVGNMEIAQTLIARGADMNMRDKNGHTAMGWAAHEGHIDLARMLHQAGAKE